MPPEDRIPCEVRGAVKRGLVPLMRESGYRAEAVGISDLSAIRRGNRVGLWRGLRILATTCASDSGGDSGLGFHFEDEECSNY